MENDKKNPLFNKKKTPLNALRDRLYMRNTGPLKGKRRPLNANDIEAPKEWDDIVKAKKKAKKISFITKFFVFSVIFFLISLAIALFIFMKGGNIVSSENVEIVVSGPTSIGAGDEVTLQIIIENRNNVDLNFTDLIITYPEGTRVAGNVEQELKRSRKSLDTVKSNQIATETISAVFFGQEGSSQEMFIELEYRVKGSNAIFVARGKYDVLISSAPIDLLINVLKEVGSGQEVELEIIVRSNSTEIVKGLLVEIDYPFGYSYKSASPLPIFDNSVWRIGDLEPRGERTILIRGTLVGQDGDEKVFRIESGGVSVETNNSIGIVYNSVLTSIIVGRPFLGLQFTIAGDSSEEYSVVSNERISAEISWINTMPTKISNAEIEVHISGEVLDKSSVRVPRGFFRSSDDTIIWNKNTEQDLAVIEPGSRGSVVFDFESLPLFNNSGTIFKNPIITIEIIARGERLGESGIVNEIDSSMQKKVKIISDIGFTGRAVYYDGPFSNTGPLPPQVDNETTYTILWSIVNSSNIISRTKIEATLPPGVRWAGKVSPSSEDVTYDSRDGVVSWDLGIVAGGVGITLSPREVAFQIALVPSILNLNYQMSLIGDAIFSSNDEFAGVPLEAMVKSLDTALFTDPQYISGQDRVVE